jgi:hypothetical protein
MHSSVSDLRSFREADWDTNHYVVVAKVKEKLSVKKQRSQRFNLNNLNKPKRV